MNYSRKILNQKNERVMRALKKARQEKRRKLLKRKLKVFAKASIASVTVLSVMTAGAMYLNESSPMELTAQTKNESCLISGIIEEIYPESLFIDRYTLVAEMISDATVVSANDENLVKAYLEVAEEESPEEVAVQEDVEEKGFPEYANEAYLLAQIIECEAGKTFEDKIYVASVIINRARTNYYSFSQLGSIRDVLYQNFGRSGQQYATATVRKVEAGITPSEDSLRAANGLIDGSIECLKEEVLFQDTTYRSWMAGKLEEVKLEGSCQYYGRPLDFERGCN